MRAAIVRGEGDAPVVGAVDEPVPADGEVLVDVELAALNPIDLHIANGRFRDGPPQVPYVPGVEGVGTVDGQRVRFEVVGLHPGYGTNGCLAERTLAPAAIVSPLPAGVDAGAAAAVGASGMTALRALEHAGLRAGETVLVLGGTGVVGRLTVQVARALGAGRVVAAGRSEQGLARARELGADACVRIGDGALASALRDACPDGIDVIVDALWGEPAVAALEAAALDVRLVNFGRTAGPAATIEHALRLRKRASVLGLSTAMDSVEVRRGLFDRLVAEIAAGRLVVEYETLPLDRVGEAWSLQAASPGRKLLLRTS
jgi:NADPH:quinone reductase